MTTFYHVTTPAKGADDKTRFRRIGVAFPQKEGSKSVMRIHLDAVPLNGELVLFEPGGQDNDDAVAE